MEREREKFCVKYKEISWRVRRKKRRRRRRRRRSLNFSRCIFLLTSNLTTTIRKSHSSNNYLGSIGS